MDTLKDQEGGKPTKRWGQWKSRPSLKAVVWLLVIGALLLVGWKVNELWGEWQQLRQARAAADYAQVRGFIGLHPASFEIPPQPMVRRVDGRQLLWANTGRSQSGWYDITECWLRPGGFNYEMVMFQGIQNPIRVPAHHLIARRLIADDQVFGLSLGDQECAYPKMVMDRVAVVNDELAGMPLLLTYYRSSSMVNAGVFRREIQQGTPPLLEVTGYVYRQQPVFYDQKSESLWYTDTGSGDLLAVSGSLQGQRLRLIRRVEPSPWRSWRDQHPDTLVLIGSDHGQPPAVARITRGSRSASLPEQPY